MRKNLKFKISKTARTSTDGKIPWGQAGGLRPYGKILRACARNKNYFCAYPKESFQVYYRPPHNREEIATKLQKGSTQRKKREEKKRAGLGLWKLDGEGIIWNERGIGSF